MPAGRSDLAENRGTLADFVLNPKVWLVYRSRVESRGAVRVVAVPGPVRAHSRAGARPPHRVFTVLSGVKP